MDAANGATDAPTANRSDTLHQQRIIPTLSAFCTPCNTIIQEKRRYLL